MEVSLSIPDLSEARLLTYPNLVFFIIPCAYFMIFTATGGLIDVLKDAYGKQYWVWLNFCFYFPGFPVTAIQSRMDLRFDVAYGSISTFQFRMLAALSLHFCCAVVLVYERQRGTFLILMVVVGIFHAVAHSTACQLVQLFPPSSTVAWQTGVRFPDVVALVLVLAFDATDGPLQDSSRIDWYYVVVASVVLLGAVAWGSMLCRSDEVQTALELKDDSVRSSIHPHECGIDGYDKLKENADDFNPIVSPQGYQSMEAKDIITLETLDEDAVNDRIWFARLALFITITSSIFLGNFFSYVKSSGNANISTILYFTRLFCDLGSRPAAHMVKIGLLGTPHKLLAAAGFRVSLMTVFFLYIGKAIPQSDVFITLFVAFYAFMSGYLVVNSYQMSQHLAGETSATRDIASRLMNTAYQLGTFCSSILSVVLALVINAC